MKRNEITLKALRILGHTSLVTVDLLDFMFSGGQRTSRGNIQHIHDRIYNRHTHLDLLIERAKEKQKFYSLLYYLQSVGLVKKETKKKRIIWSITKKGKEKRYLLENKLQNSQKIYLSTKNYDTIPTQSFIIIIFDIPETEKTKRVWLRDVLKNLDFKMLQKSVWIGKNQVPAELLYDLKKINILSFVKIFSVLEEGNINK